MRLARKFWFVVLICSSGSKVRQDTLATFCLLAILATIFVISTAGSLKQVYADDGSGSSGTDSSSSSDNSGTDSSNSASATTPADSNTNTQSDPSSSGSNTNDAQIPDQQADNSSYNETSSQLNGINATQIDSLTNSTNNSNSTENQNSTAGTHNSTNWTNHLTPTHNHAKSKTNHHLPLHKHASQTALSTRSNLIMQLDHITSITSKIGYVKMEKKANQTLFELVGQGYLVSQIRSADELNNFSISVWARPDYSKGSDQFTIVSKERAFTLGINNNISPHGLAEFSVFNGIKWITVQSKAEIDDGIWTHIAATFNGTTISLYINGKIDSSLPVEGLPHYFPNGMMETIPLHEISSGSNLIIGAYHENARGVTFEQFSGIIYNLKLYNLSLTQSSINDIYQKEIPET